MFARPPAPTSRALRVGVRPRGPRWTRVLLLAGVLLLLLAPVSHAVTVSGTAVRDDWGVTWQECDGVTTNIGIAVGSSKVANVACDGSSGAFLATGVTIPAPGTLVTAYFDGAITKGVAYTVSANTTSDIAGLVAMQNDVSVRSEAVAGTVLDSTLQPWDSTEDADVPFTGSTWPTTTSVGVGVHVRGDDTFRPGFAGLVMDSADVMPGATLVAPASRAFTFRASGTASCEFETGVQRPLCVRAGGTFVSTGDSGPTFQGSGTFAIEARTYSILHIQGGANSLAILGTGPGQTVSATWRMIVSSPTTSDPWSPNITAGGSGGLTNNGIEIHSTWRGTGRFTITATNTFRGGGLLDLPGADVQLAPAISRFTLGNITNRWSVRSLSIGGTYQRYVMGIGTTAATTGLNSGGTNFDETVTIKTHYAGEQLAMMNVGVNGGDVALVMYGLSTIPPSTTWDNQAPWPVDGDAMLLLGEPGSNERVTGFAENGGGSPGCGSSARITIYGTSDGDFAMWALCISAGFSVSWDTSFNGTGRWIWDGGGASDTIRWAIYTSWGQSTTMQLAGTTGASEFRVLTLDTATGVISNNISWDNGGAGAEMLGYCTGAGGWLFVGRTGTAGSRDWAARAYDTNTQAWRTGANSTITWDAGGGSDEATECYASGSYLFLMGKGQPGADDDLRIRAYWSDGSLATQWGSAGLLTIANAGADYLHSILQDNGAFFMFSENAGGGGRTEIRHIDPDGDVDTTFGANGVVTWNPTAGRDAPNTATYDRSGTQIYVPGTADTNGGDAIAHYIDLMGDHFDAVEPGRTSIQMASGGIGIEQDLEVGTVATTGTPIIDAESYDAAVSVGGSMHVRATGGYRASSIRRLTLAGDLTVRGMFDPGMGRVDLVGDGEPARLDVAASTSFRDLVIRGRGKRVSVVPGVPVRVLRSLTVAGTSCAEPITLESTIAGSPWTLDAAAGITTSLANLAVQDSTVTTTPLSSASGRSISGNTNWTLAGCGASTTPAPDEMQVDGVPHAVSVGTSSPVLSWRNNHATTVDRGDVELYSSSPAGQLGLWRLDGTGADASGNGRTVTQNGAASYVAGKFSTAVQPGSTVNTDYFTTSASTAYDVDAWTVDGWLRFDASLGSGTHVIASHCATTSWNTCNIGFKVEGAVLQMQAYKPGGVAAGSTGINITSMLDGNWHHVAAAYADGHSAVYIDGVIRASGDDERSGTSTPLVQPGTGFIIGNGLGTGLDDIRLLDYAVTPSEIRGYYKTGRRHHELVWDFDPSDANGTVLGASAGVGARVNVPYGGAADSIRLDGARYSVRARLRNTGAVWSDWSGYDWFETAQSMVLALPTGPRAVMSASSVAGEDVAGSVALDITTNSIHGYTMSVTGPSDSWSLSDGVPGPTHEFAGWGTPATPAAWPLGTSGSFGLTVLSATGGKDTARWGTGTLPEHFTTLKYGWAKRTEPMLLHSRSVYDPTTNRVVIGMRGNAAPGQSPGSFATTLTLSVVPNV